MSLHSVAEPDLGGRGAEADRAAYRWAPHSGSSVPLAPTVAVRFVLGW